mmetsp:Transcript_4417/g.8481  ORF Transcript_4417/g.8481 Transcript_4417/m.8481 type:complete len:252 (+) Transcript_4417:3103-3858(+)
MEPSHGMFKIVSRLRNWSRQCIRPSFEIENVVNQRLEIRPPLLQEVNRSLRTIIPIASPRQDAANVINELRIFLHPSVHELFQLRQVLPLRIGVGVGLYAIHPIEQRHDEFQLGICHTAVLQIGIPANYGRRLAKVHVGIPARPSVVVRPLSQEVIDATKPTRAPRHERAPSPPAASLDGYFAEGAGVSHASDEFEVVSVPVSRVVFRKVFGHAGKWRGRTVSYSVLILRWVVIVLGMELGRHLHVRIEGT